LNFAHRDDSIRVAKAVTQQDAVVQPHPHLMHEMVIGDNGDDDGDKKYESHLKFQQRNTAAAITKQPVKLSGHCALNC
jgi:hypothetical protein